MAVLDSNAGEIIIRIVYDGPPEAGKTTSLRALGGSLAQKTHTPEEDGRGRTLWFDWMEYTGGRFEGYRIRCQIVSVPGQSRLGARRRRLLSGADAVIFVGDSTKEGFAISSEYLAELREVLGAVAGPPVGVLFQANKRDLPGALDLAVLRERLSIGVVASIAADGTGIREAFVYAVRLALDRVREQMNQRVLPSGRAAEGSADELLAALRAGEVESPPVRVDTSTESVAAGLLRDVLESEQEAKQRTTDLASTRGAPKPPDASVPSGAIWPPVEGRAILYEVSQLPLNVRKMPNGGFATGLGTGWRVVGSPTAVFATLDQGRTALIQWARLHASHGGLISPRRCIVLADGGDGSWRLWQIVRAEESLRDLVASALKEIKTDILIYRLCWAAQLLLEAQAKLAQAPCLLPCSIDTVGAFESRAVYIGLMPDASSRTKMDQEPRFDGHALLRMQLGPVVTDQLTGRRNELSTALARVPRQFLYSDTILTTFSGMLAT